MSSILVLNNYLEFERGLNNKISVHFGVGGGRFNLFGRRYTTLKSELGSRYYFKSFSTKHNKGFYAKVALNFWHDEILRKREFSEATIDDSGIFTQKKVQTSQTTTRIGTGLRLGVGYQTYFLKRLVFNAEFGNLVSRELYKSTFVRESKAENIKEVNLGNTLYLNLSVGYDW
ncbi:MAG: hypothetical protein SNJ77_03900 [Cytophagales bacterium]